MLDRYSKHLFPLCVLPRSLRQFITHFGASENLQFEDVLSLDDPRFLLRPALSAILIFPTTLRYEERQKASESERPEYN